MLDRNYICVLCYTPICIVYLEVLIRPYNIPLVPVIHGGKYTLRYRHNQGIPFFYEEQLPARSIII